MTRVSAILAPQEFRVPQFEDAPKDEEATLEVDVAVIEGAKIDIEMDTEQDVDTEGRLDYGSDEERTMACIRTLEDVLERG